MIWNDIKEINRWNYIRNNFVKIDLALTSISGFDNSIFTMSIWPLSTALYK